MTDVTLASSLFGDIQGFLVLGAGILLIVLSFSEKWYNLLLKKILMKVDQLNTWRRDSQTLSQPAEFHVITGVLGHSELLAWMEYGGYFSLQNSLWTNWVRKHMQNKMQTCQKSPLLRSKCIYVCTYACPPSSRKNLMYPWHFSICTKQFILSSFHKLQIFTSIHNQGKCGSIQIFWKFTLLEENVLSF